MRKSQGCDPPYNKKQSKPMMLHPIMVICRVLEMQRKRQYIYMTLPPSLPKLHMQDYSSFIKDLPFIFQMPWIK